MKRKKRDRSLSKIIDFRSPEQREKAQKKARKEGMTLKAWIETLIEINTDLK